MSDAFSSHSTDVISRSIDLAPTVTPEDLDSSLEEVYEILETAAELNKHDFRRVSRMGLCMIAYLDALLEGGAPIPR